jgi:hypothetical protein
LAEASEDERHDARRADADQGKEDEPAVEAQRERTTIASLKTRRSTLFAAT